MRCIKYSLDTDPSQAPQVPPPACPKVFRCAPPRPTNADWSKSASRECDTLSGLGNVGLSAADGSNSASREYETRGSDRGVGLSVT